MGVMAYCRWQMAQPALPKLEGLTGHGWCESNFERDYAVAAAVGKKPGRAGVHLGGEGLPMHTQRSDGFEDPRARRICSQCGPAAVRAQVSVAGHWAQGEADADVLGTEIPD